MEVGLLCIIDIQDNVYQLQCVFNILEKQEEEEEEEKVEEGEEPEGEEPEMEEEVEQSTCIAIVACLSIYRGGGGA